MLFNSFLDGKNYDILKKYLSSREFREFGTNLDLIEKVIDKSDIVEIYPQKLYIMEDGKGEENKSFILYIFTKTTIIELKPIEAKIYNTKIYKYSNVESINLNKKDYDVSLTIIFKNMNELIFSSTDDCNYVWNSSYKNLIVNIANLLYGKYEKI